MVRALVIAVITTLALGPAAPNASADALGDVLGALPPGYGEAACMAASAGPLVEPGALAMVECVANSLPGGPVRARYTLFSDAASLETAFSAIYGSHHFEAMTCPGVDSSPTPWFRPDDGPGGSIACGHVEGGSVALLWMNAAHRYIGLAEGGSTTNGLQGPDINDLWGWWSDSVSSVRGCCR